MDGLCGSTFWDRNVTWDTDDPNFTPCFQETILVWIPCCFLWLTAAYAVYSALSSRTKNIHWNSLNTLKIGTIATLLISQLVAAIHIQFFSSRFEVGSMEWYNSFIKFVTFGLALFLELLNKRHGIRTSGILFLFWVLVVFFEIPVFRTLIINPEFHPRFRESLLYIIEYIYAPFVLLQLFLTCFADAEPEYDADMQVVEKPCPEKNASFLSQISFFWFESLARKGHRKPLEFCDLWDLSPENSSKSLNVKFSKYWEEALERTRAEKIPVPEPNAEFQKTSSQVDIKYKPDKAATPTKIVGIMPVIVKAFGGTFFFASFLKLIHDVLVFVSPLILKLIINHVHSDEAAWKGYFYVGLLFVAELVATFNRNQYFYLMSMVGLRMRTTIVGSIYRKALRISSSSKEDSTIGEIVNLMSVDAQKLTELCPYITTLWSAPFQIALSLYFLYQLLGASVFAGLGVMFLLLPINMVMGIKVKRYQVRQMKNKDKRLNLMSELLSGIKVLKLYAWEPSFQKNVMKIREEEVRVLRESAYVTAAAMFLWTCAPVVVAIVTFATYILVDETHVLNAEKAFVSLALLNIMRVPFNLLPMMMVSIVQAMVGVKRINKYMNSEEIDKDAVERNSEEAESVVIENGNFAWNEETPTLRNIDIKVKEGSLVAVVGSVGSGKSSLLAAVLGDIHKQSGRVNAKGRLAYIAQQAWIQNASVRDNITFGRPFEQNKYNQVIESCALKPDLEILPAGDQTEIGEKGINLSGGQKQRIALARATYQNCDVYLLDDPLSAVDSHVGKHIFENVIGPNGALKKRTRLLVTHGVTFLPQMDNIIVLKDGEITEVGTYKELLERKGAFAEFLIQHLGSDENEGEEDLVKDIMNDLEHVIGPKEAFMSQKSVESKGNDSQNKNVSNGDLNSNPIRKSSTLEREPKSPKRKENLIETEEMEIGTIKWDVFLYYLKAIGLPLSLASFTFQLFFQFFAVGSNVLLAFWSNEKPVNNTQDGRNTYLGVYAAMGAGQALAIFLATVVMATGALKASSLLHSRLLMRILRAPMSFFDTTPLGRILNRFSKDIEVTDNSVPMSLSSWIKCVLNVIATFVIIAATTPMFIVVIIPTGILYFLAQRFYVSTSRQLKRLESVTRSPIYSHFTETLAGSTTIRAFAMQENFIAKSESIVDQNQMCYFPSIVSMRFLAVFLESVGNIVIFFAALFAVIYGDMLSAGVVGLSVSYALQITQALNWLVETTNNVENNLVAVERLKEYGEVDQEAEWEIHEERPPETWPDSGEVIFEKYQTRYRKDLDLVLQNVSCHIQPGEKVGIVGRTGAGKSSLALGLFRLIEATGGSITIDGQDIAKMGLHDLRRHLTVIPQDPVIFAGTVRANLDPFLLYSDDAIWKALELAHFKSYIKGLNSGLEYELSEGGENLSVGQRQLICLARALLRKTKILVLDEATAAIDLETDDLIQATIRKEFNDSTILTIAHRLNTIMDYTRIMVLQEGVVQEFDTPSNLLKNKDSLFYAMAKDAGLA